TDSTHYYYPFQTALDAEPLASNFTIYPNPASSYVMIPASESWAMYSSTGMVVMKSHRVDPYSQSIDVSQLIPGIYSIVVLYENRTSVEQFLKL
ncbi:MAG TPA: T9SS type A sorting domain-containing protein, partial [Saprospiraceae bacterium]|nr:T9SS type A sorting domain-containing protein [Saprospiraceae bacterium]